MYLTRHAMPVGERWAVDGKLLPGRINLGSILKLSAESIPQVLIDERTSESATGKLLAPIEPDQEVWAAGVTYLRSREARVAESETADIYTKVYDAERVEIFFKALGIRVIGDGQPVRIRADSEWNVPEPELTIVLNSAGEIVGYTAGNDMSSRDIEGANPLYLPQAKVYDGSCAIGPGIIITNAASQRAVPIRMSITRNQKVVFQGETSSAQLKRTLEEIAAWLTRELTFDYGVFLMTGTCLVPEDEFSLQASDLVRIEVGDLVLENPVSG